MPSSVQQCRAINAIVREPLDLPALELLLFTQVLAFPDRLPDFTEFCIYSRRRPSARICSRFDFSVEAVLAILLVFVTSFPGDTKWMGVQSSLCDGE